MMQAYAVSYHEQKEECVICLDDIETEWRELECHHRYHKKCIEDWITIRAKCPMCMKNIKDNTIEDENSIWNTDPIIIRRFVLFIVLIMGAVIVTVICNS
jgi:hypothetical protein